MRIELGFEGWYVVDGSEAPDPGCEEFRGHEAFALNWLRRFRSDLTAMAAMRRQFPEANSPKCTDDEILQKAARALASGSWKARKARRASAASASGGGGGSAGPAVVFGPSFPLEHRHKADLSTATGRIPDSPSFSNEADLNAIADALKRASARGAAFCEECSKRSAGA